MIAGFPYHPTIGAIAEDAGAAIPDHYLIPMNKTSIDIYIGKHLYMWKDSPFYVECAADWDGESMPCTWALIEIERHNLYFVNKIISYEELLSAYNQAADAMASIPHLPTLKEQLRDAGKFLVGSVVGFFTSGPIGLFTGGAAAVSEILAREKARRAARIQTLLDPALDTAQQAEVLLRRREQLNMLKVYALWGGGALAVSGIVWWMLSE